MPAAPSAERLVAARSEVKRACEFLVDASPEAVERCQGALERAVSELAEFRSKGAAVPGNGGARSAAYGLRAEVRRAAGLLQSLADFYHGWERILGAMSAGYTATGDPAAVARRGRLYCRG
jgi:plasmid stabilization system protein ParE